MDTATIIDGLTHYDRLPVTAIKAAGANRAELVPEFLRLIDQHLEGTAASDGEPGLFLVFHLLGEWREPSAYRPLARLLRCPHIREDLDDALTMTAHQVMAAVFDGDPQPLYDVILDTDANEFARSAMLEALATVVCEGRLPRAEAARFLSECFTTLRPIQGSFVWSGWQEAVALLGLEDLKPLVKQAFDRGSIEVIWLSYDDFEGDLAYAVAHPEAPDAVAKDRHRLFGDTIEELSTWYGFSEAYFADERRLARDEARRASIVYAIEDPVAPFVDPSRRVGRNDPCPCGSGKKYKKCCLN